MNPEQSSAAPKPPTVATKAPTPPAKPEQPVQSQPPVAASTPVFAYKATQKVVLTTTALMVLTFAIGMSSFDPGIVDLTQKLCGIIALVWSVTAGITVASRMNESIYERRQHGVDLNHFLATGVLLIIPVALLGCFAAGAGGLFIAVPAVIAGSVLMVIGMFKQPALPEPSSPKHVGTALKVMMIVLAFLAGGIPTAILGLLAMFSLWSRWCNLTSSKCL